MAIVSYSLAKLPHNQKMKVNYSLSGKQNRKGMVEESRGKKLGDGCFMIPQESLEKATATLKQFNVRFNLMRVYAPPQTTERRLRQR